MHRSRLPVSCCLIIKNEELFLKQCLSSFEEWADEILILDSGSTDASLAIAEEFRNRVPRIGIETIQWRDDFSWARNLIASRARNEWILCVDGDEILDESAHSKISQAIATDEICFSIIQRNYTTDSQVENVQSCLSRPPYYLDENPLFFFDNRMERLYRHRDKIQFEGRIHESLIPSVTRAGRIVQNLDLIFHHYGRLKTNHRKKILYYLSLSKQKWNEERNNPAAWIEYITALAESQQMSEALRISIDAKNIFKNEAEIQKIAFQICLRTDSFELAEASIKDYLSLKPNDLYAHAQLTTALLYQKKWGEMLKCAHNLLCSDPQNFVAHLNLGVLYFECKDWQKSKLHLNAARDAKPHDEFVRASIEKVDAQLQKH